MSMYWTGYYGTALVLDRNEFQQFSERYCCNNNLDICDMEARIEDEGIREMGFFRSVGDGCFSIVDISPDCCDGMVLTPYYLGGTANKNGDIVDYRKKGETCYVIFTDYALDDVEALEKPPYASYQDLKLEFIRKLGLYLPEDFDWDRHIGRFRYAAFA